jgi:hypothetical protein
MAVLMKPVAFAPFKLMTTSGVVGVNCAPSPPPMATL